MLEALLQKVSTVMLWIFTQVGTFDLAIFQPSWIAGF